MDDLEKNNRKLLTSFAIMLAILAVLITIGELLFPEHAFVDPNAGLIRGLINTPSGNIIAICLIGLVAGNIGFFLNTLTAIERERVMILAKQGDGNARAPELLENLKATGAINTPTSDTEK